MITAAMLHLIQDAGEGVLVLVDGLDEADFQRSRLTRHEVRRQLQLLADLLEALPGAAHDAMPEIDWGAWRAVGLALASPALAQDDAAWFAARALVPATLSWLRVYRQGSPALFDYVA